MKIAGFLIGCLFLLTSIALADYSETRQLNLDVDDIDELVIDCGAGILQITGVENLSTIEISAEIEIEGIRESKARDFMDRHMNLSLKNRRGYARLESTFEDMDFPFPFFSDARSARIDLIIRVPKDLQLDIHDGSGDIEIEDMGNSISIKDGSGDISLERITGKLVISDGSGEMKLYDIKGEVRLEDGSGDIRLKGIEGNITLNDGSGDIDLENITGSIDIEDGSGEITGKSVEGDIYVDDGSGDIDIGEIGGDVEIDDGSGGMEIVQVGGTVIVNDGSGDIRIDDVKGDVEILDDDSGRCKITGVEGRVRR